MVKILKALLVVSMIIVWLGTAIVFYLSSGIRGKIVTIGSGLIINILLAIAYSLLVQRPATWRDWFKM